MVALEYVAGRALPDVHALVAVSRDRVVGDHVTFTMILPAGAPLCRTQRETEFQAQMNVIGMFRLFCRTTKMYRVALKNLYDMMIICVRGKYTAGARDRPDGFAMGFHG